MRLPPRLLFCFSGVLSLVHNNDGTGGSPPSIYQYVIMNADVTMQWTGADPHAVHGLNTKDNGYVAVGFALASESSTKFAGFVNRVDLCANTNQYDSTLGAYLNQPGSNCANRFTWSYLNKNNNRNLKLAWVAESPDGSYILAAGVRQATSQTNRFNGYIAKLNAATGVLIWDFDVPTDSGALSGARSGFETIAFTEDGGFIVGGFMNRQSTEFPYFKSSGQVDDGTPVLHKFSAATANAASMNNNPSPVWTYKCAGSNQCQFRFGSAKAIRIYKDQGVEKVVTVPGPKSEIIVVDATNGQELMYQRFEVHDESRSTGTELDGTASDIEVEFDANGNVAGFVTNGLDFSPVSNDGGVNCGADGCMRIRGVFTKYAPDLQSKVWQTKFNTGDWPGGLYQHSNTPASPYKSLIYTECFGVTKVKDGNGNHIGYVASCGSGAEGCDFQPNAIKQYCNQDSRREWRGTTVRTDLAGNIVWYRMDSFKDSESNNVISSAAEYIFTRPDGKTVIVSDETMGFGFLTLDCEAGVTCPGSGTTTTQAPTTTTQTTTTVAPTPSTASTASTASTGPTQTTTTVTSVTGTTPTGECPFMKWKGKKATKLMYRGTKNGKRSYIVRQAVLNNSDFHPNLRTSPYTGFFMFSRRYCGTDFFDALSDGTIKLGMYDYESTYQVQFRHTRIDGSKGSSVTVQYHQSFVGATDAPWSKSGGNSVKKDQFYLTISGIPDSWDASKEAACFNLLTGVLPVNYDMQADWTQCASTQKDAGF